MTTTSSTGKRLGLADMRQVQQRARRERAQVRAQNRRDRDRLEGLEVDESDNGQDEAEEFDRLVEERVQERVRESLALTEASFGAFGGANFLNSSSDTPAFVPSARGRASPAFVPAAHGLAPPPPLPYHVAPQHMATHGLQMPQAVRPSLQRDDPSDFASPVFPKSYPGPLGKGKVPLRMSISTPGSGGAPSALRTPQPPAFYAALQNVPASPLPLVSAPGSAAPSSQMYSSHVFSPAPTPMAPSQGQSHGSSWVDVDAKRARLYAELAALDSGVPPVPPPTFSFPPSAPPVLQPPSTPVASMPVVHMQQMSVASKFVPHAPTKTMPSWTRGEARVYIESLRQWGWYQVQARVTGDMILLQVLDSWLKGALDLRALSAQVRELMMDAETPSPSLEEVLCELTDRTKPPSQHTVEELVGKWRAEIRAPNEEAREVMRRTEEWMRQIEKEHKCLVVHLTAKGHTNVVETIGDVQSLCGSPKIQKEILLRSLRLSPKVKELIFGWAPQKSKVIGLSRDEWLDYLDAYEEGYGSLDNVEISIAPGMPAISQAPQPPRNARGLESADQSDEAGFLALLKFKQVDKGHCFNCRLAGHIWKECPLSELCKWCLRPGHRVMACPAREKGNNQAFAVTPKMVNSIKKALVPASQVPAQVSKPIAAVKGAGKGKSSGTPGSEKLCPHCKSTKHLPEKCWQKFPELKAKYYADRGQAVPVSRRAAALLAGAGTANSNTPTTTTPSVGGLRRASRLLHCANVDSMSKVVCSTTGFGGGKKRTSWRFALVDSCASETVVPFSHLRRLQERLGVRMIKLNSPRLYHLATGELVAADQAIASLPFSLRTREGETINFCLHNVTVLPDGLDGSGAAVLVGVDWLLKLKAAVFLCASPPHLSVVDPGSGACRTVELSQTNGGVFGLQVFRPSPALRSSSAVSAQVDSSADDEPLCALLTKLPPGAAVKSPPILSSLCVKVLASAAPCPLPHPDSEPLSCESDDEGSVDETASFPTEPVTALLLAPVLPAVPAREPSPAALRNALWMHAEMGHGLSQQRQFTEAMARQGLDPSLSTRVLEQCVECALLPPVAPPRRNHLPVSQTQTRVQRPGSVVQLDFVHLSLPQGSHGPRSFCVGHAIDVFSRVSLLMACPKENPDYALRLLKKWQDAYGAVDAISTDGGSSFQSSTVTDYCAAWGIHSSPRPQCSPWLQGQVESRHRILRNIWDGGQPGGRAGGSNVEKLARLQGCVNSLGMAALGGRSPLSVMLARRSVPSLMSLESLEIPCLLDYTQSAEDSVEMWRDVHMEHLDRTAKMAMAFPHLPAQSDPVPVGAVCWFWTHPAGGWRGPARVLAELPGGGGAVQWGSQIYQRQWGHIQEASPLLQLQIDDTPADGGSDDACVEEVSEAEDAAPTREEAPVNEDDSALDFVAPSPMRPRTLFAADDVVLVDPALDVSPGRPQRNRRPAPSRFVFSVLDANDEVLDIRCLDDGEDSDDYVDSPSETESELDSVYDISWVGEPFNDSAVPLVDSAVLASVVPQEFEEHAPIAGVHMAAPNLSPPPQLVPVEDQAVVVTPPKEELMQEKWVKSMTGELQGFVDNNTFVPVDVLPVGAKAIGSRWVYALKPQPPPALGPKHKSRVVIQGTPRADKRGVPKEDLRSPTPTWAEVLLVCLLAVEQCWAVWTIDIPQAFLRSATTLFAEWTARWGQVYVRPPPFMDQEWVPEALRIKTKGFWKLTGSCYGLCDAPFLWFTSLSLKLEEWGYTAVPLRPCMSRFTVPGAVHLTLLLTRHVDDIIMTGTPEAKERFSALLAKEWAADKWEEVNDKVGVLFTGVRMTKTDVGSLSLSTKNYLNNIAPAVSAPGVQTERLRPAEITECRRVIGELAWCASRCVPLGLVVSSIMASRCTSLQSTRAELTMLNKCLASLKAQAEGVILFRSFASTPKTALVVWGDQGLRKEVGSGVSDAPQPDLKRRQIGIFAALVPEELYLSLSQQKPTADVSPPLTQYPIWPLHWSSRKSKRVCTSTWSGELLGVSEAWRCASRLRRLVRLLTTFTERPPLVLCDNEGVVNSVTKGTAPEDSSKEELVAELAECVERKEFLLSWCPTRMNIADILSKIGVPSVVYNQGCWNWSPQVSPSGEPRL
jgi:hypothetical protein